MPALDQLDRWIVRFMNATSLWAIDTPLEPIATARRRTEPAATGDIAPASLQLMESSLRRVVTGFRNWLIAGAAILIVFPIVIVFEPDSAALASLVVLALSMLAWVVWIVVAILAWRTMPGYGLADSVAVALKRGQLDADATAAIASLPADSLLILMLQPLLKQRP